MPPTEAKADVLLHRISLVHANCSTVGCMRDSVQTCYQHIRCRCTMRKRIRIRGFNSFANIPFSSCLCLFSLPFFPFFSLSCDLFCTDKLRAWARVTTASCLGGLTHQRLCPKSRGPSCCLPGWEAGGSPECHAHGTVRQQYVYTCMSMITTSTAPLAFLVVCNSCTYL